MMAVMSTPDNGGSQLYEGRCVGGPLDGEAAASRYPTGFVLADKPAGKAWIYDRAGDGTFAVREADGRRLDPRRATAAAIGEEYDVVAAPWGGGGDGGA
jgi:hypothetical protein